MDILLEEDIEVCQRDGEEVVLGSGAFGKVEHLLCHDSAEQQLESLPTWPACSTCAV